MMGMIIMSTINRVIHSNEISRKKRRWYVYLLSVYILITPLSMVEIPVVGSAMKMASIGVFVITLTLLYSDNIILKLRNPLILAWAAYVAYTFLSIFWSTNFNESLSTATGLIEVFLISFALTQVELRDEDIRTVEFAWIMVSLISLLMLFGGGGQQYEYGGRTTIVLSSGGADPNEFCAYFYMTLAILMVRLFQNKSKMMMPLYLVFMAAIFYCILITGSRGGLFSAAAVVVVSWLFSTSISVKKIILLGITIASIYLAFVYLFAPNLPQSVLERFQLESMIADQGSGRTDIWRTALEDIFSGTTRVIYGYGPFGVAFMRSVMHNQFLQALMDGGIIGLIIYLNFVIQLFLRAYRNGPEFLGGVAGAMIALMTLTAYSYFKPVWIIFMMCLLTISKDQVQPKNLTFPDERNRDGHEYRSMGIEGAGIGVGSRLQEENR